MSRTEEILEAIRRELELRRDSIDQDPTLAALSVMVYMQRPGGRPETISVRPEFKAIIPRGGCREDRREESTAPQAILGRR